MKWIFDAVFDRMDRAVVHGSTFSKNDLAMAAGLATLDVMAEEKLVERAAELGPVLMDRLRDATADLAFQVEVRGKGLMIGPPMRWSRRPGAACSASSC